MAEDYKHIKKFCIENVHGLKSSKTAMEQTFEVMFKKLREQAYTISHPAESICIGFLI
jgi:site-specific DNA-cytosine methylase